LPACLPGAVVLYFESVLSQGNFMPTREHTHRTGDYQVRVRYKETDQMGVLYHGNYFTFFEIGRTELLRSCGYSYRELEASGVLGVVVKAECSYHKPAKYDDLLTIRTTIKRITRVKIEYEHLVLRDSELLATGRITLAFVNRDGIIQRVPDWMMPED
jgi:acyl-CoA thioester hydrolase